ncbi:MAG: hypothetical protein GWP10_10020 [Nitrospiraceae bacterium]|nr:hypothetical protein [Nitrospiraceae bacterium]
MSEFDSYIRNIHRKIDKRLATTMPKEIYDITAGGKKLRGILTVLVFEEFLETDPAKKTEAYDLACVIEVIHALTLAADDIIDQDEMRRGKPSLYTLKGFSLAFLEIISGLSVPYSIVATYGSKYIKAISKTQRDMCAGVIKEIVRDMPATALYETIISRKTGSLFSLAARFGAMAAEASDEEINHFAGFGNMLGNTYQIQDDIQDLLNVVSGEKTKDVITGTEFLLLKCVQLDDLTKQLIRDILDGSVKPEKAGSLLYKAGIINTLVKKREKEKQRTIETLGSGHAMLRRYVEHCVPVEFL